MPPLCRSATAAEMPALCAMLDREFISDRGRTISLSRRFPSTLGIGNVDNILLALVAGETAAALLSRPFSWQFQGKRYKGAMIGAVCTGAAYRGQGLATLLLGYAASRFQEQGIEFAVLWSTQHGFYEKSGWICLDHGMFGDSGERNHVGSALAEVEVRPLSPAEDSRLDAISARYMPGKVARSLADWEQLPVPAERVDALLWKRDGKVAAYALAGRAGTTAFVYEMAGDEEGFSAIWRMLASSCARILVNDHPRHESCRWLSAHAGIAWENKRLAMWLPLSVELKAAPQTFADWYISYFDRI